MLYEVITGALVLTKAIIRQNWKENRNGYFQKNMQRYLWPILFTQNMVFGTNILITEPAKMSKVQLGIWLDECDTVELAEQLAYNLLVNWPLTDIIEITDHRIIWQTITLTNVIARKAVLNKLQDVEANLFVITSYSIHYTKLYDTTASAFRFNHGIKAYIL